MLSGSAPAYTVRRRAPSAFRVKGGDGVACEHRLRGETRAVTETRASRKPPTRRRLGELAGDGDEDARAPSAFRVKDGAGDEGGDVACELFEDDAVTALVSCRSTHALNRSANASMESTANAAASSETFGSNPKPSSRNACGRVICPLRSSACSSCIVSALVFAALTSSLLGLALRAGALPSPTAARSIALVGSQRSGCTRCAT